MAKEIQFNEQARASIRKGIDKLAEAVKMTLGPRGRAVVIERLYGAPTVTFDGVTVAKEIDLEDRWENLGAEFIKQAADKTNDGVGDGTTTSTVLAHALINAGEKEITTTGFNVINLAEVLKQKGAEIIKALEEQKDDVNDAQKITEVATLSAKDAKIGELISTVMNKVGKDGVVTVDDSNTLENSYEVVEGLRFDRGYISAYFVTNQERMEAVLNNPVILVTDKRIASISDIVGLLNELVKSGKNQILIIADDVEGEALATLIVNKLRSVANIIAVRSPGYGEKKKEMLQDIATVTGATFISEEIGKKLVDTHAEQLGTAKKVVVTKETTTIIGGGGSEENIKDRIDQIKMQLDKAISPYDKTALQERLGKLSEGVAVVKIGGQTETAQKELKQRVDDAIAATRAAMAEGIVPGGGIALYNIYTARAQNEASGNPVDDAADRILNAALLAPITAILENSGEDVKVVLSRLDAAKKTQWTGYNAARSAIVDLKDAGIIDPLKVTKTAFLNALSVATNYLVVGAAITIIPEKKDENIAMPPQ